MTAPDPAGELHPATARLVAGATSAEVTALDAELGARLARLQARRLYRTPLDLAVALEPDLVRTPALELVARKVAEAVRTPRSRLVVSLAPQQGKSTLTSIYGGLFALVDDPDRRVATCSYSLDLARTHTRKVRNLIEQFGTGATDPATGEALPDRLGIGLARDHHAAADWSVLGHRGASLAVGVSGALTGKAVDLMFIDDPHKDREEADSETMRGRVWDWWTSVARTRLSPTGSVVIIATRWHESDMIGRLLAEQPEVWETVNVPAQATPGVPDALERPLGEWLESARGTTEADWLDARRDVGERAWASLYLGVPSPPAGGLFRREWIDTHRVEEAPELDPVAIAVDPAETGGGDDAGILVGGRAGRDLYVVGDLSGPLSQAQWARAVCLAAVTWQAGVIVQERNLGMGGSVDDAWSLLRRQATTLQDHQDAADPVTAAADALDAAGDTVAADPDQLAEVAPLATDVLALPSVRPCRVEMVTPRQSKRVRAEAVTSFYELGRAHHVGRLPRLEWEQEVWQPGQASPNRVDALAHLLAYLDTGSRAPARLSRPSRAARVPLRTVGAARR